MFYRWEKRKVKSWQYSADDPHSKLHSKLGEDLFTSWVSGKENSTKESTQAEFTRMLQQIFAKRQKLKSQRDETEDDDLLRTQKNSMNSVTIILLSRQPGNHWQQVSCVKLTSKTWLVLQCSLLLVRLRNKLCFMFFFLLCVTPRSFYNGLWFHHKLVASIEPRSMKKNGWKTRTKVMENSPDSCCIQDNSELRKNKLWVVKNELIGVKLGNYKLEIQCFYICCFQNKNKLLLQLDFSITSE